MVLIMWFWLARKYWKMKILREKSFQLLLIDTYFCKDPKFGPSFQGGKTVRPNKPAQQMQHTRGFIDGCTNRVTLISWEAEHTEQQIEQAFYMQKKKQTNILSAYYIRVTKWLVTRLQSNPIGTNFAGFGSNLKQFYWYKRRGLLFKLRRPRAFQLSRRLSTGCILIGWLQVTRWGRGIPPFHRKPKPKSRPPASPNPGSPS